MALTPGQPVELQSLYDYLVQEQRITPRAVLEFCVIVQSRASKMGVEFSLPAQARELTPEAMERVVKQFNRKIGLVEGRQEPEAPQGIAQPEVEWAPDKKRTSSKGPNKGLVAALALVAAAGAVVIGVRSSSAQAALQEVSLNQVWNGIQCARVLAGGEVAICDLPVAAWAPGRAPQVEAGARRLRESLASRGVKRVVVRLFGEGHPQHGTVVVTLL